MKSEKIAPEHNFADVMEAAGKLLKSAKKNETRMLAGMVVILSNRCDQLERQVEKLNLPSKKSAPAKPAPAKKK
ncbi:MAG: hypothetical protein H7343_06715 [Undibacterium sp.]|nr:hypothetical protein [Opitutaceae bacterium]